MRIPSLTPMFLMAATLLVAASCATTSSTHKLYEGADRPDADVASVIVPYTIELYDINGTSWSGTMSARAAKEQRLALLPGSYLFGFRFSSPYEFGLERSGVTTPRMERKAMLQARPFAPCAQWSRPSAPGRIHTGRKT